jgi:hypothetical protein
MGETQSEAEARDLSSRAPENRGGAASTVGEGEARGVNGTRSSRGRQCRRLRPILSFFCLCVTNSPRLNPDPISHVQLQQKRLSTCSHHGGVAKWLSAERAKNVPVGDGGSSNLSEADF